MERVRGREGGRERVRGGIRKKGKEGGKEESMKEF